MAVTALDIIKRAMRLLNILESGETPSGTEGADALAVLNNILDQWCNEKLMQWALKTDTAVLTPAKGTYTIDATAGELLIQRPIKIENALIRDSSNNDFKLDIIPVDRYNLIGNKTLSGSYPTYLCYSPEYPLGKIYLYPVPASALTLVLTQWSQFTNFALISSSLTMPKGYEMALAYTLASELAPEYGKNAGELFLLANYKKSLLKVVNTESILLDIDNAYKQTGEYDIYSDRNL